MRMPKNQSSKGRLMATATMSGVLLLSSVSLLSCRSRFSADESSVNFFWKSRAEQIREAIYALTQKGQSLGLVNTTTSRAEWKAKVRMQPSSGTRPPDPRDLVEKQLLTEFREQSKLDPRFALNRRDYVKEGYAAKTRTEYRFSMGYMSKYGGVPRPTTLKLRVRDYLNMQYDRDDDFKGRRFTDAALKGTKTELPNINDWNAKVRDPASIRFWEYKENISAFDTSEGTTVFVNKHRLALTLSDVNTIMANQAGLERAVVNASSGSSDTASFDISKYWIESDDAVVQAIKDNFAGALKKLQQGSSLSSLSTSEQEIDLGLVMVDLEKGKQLLETTDYERFRERAYYLNYQLADFHKFMRNDKPYEGEPYILNIRDILSELPSSGQGSYATQFKSNEEIAGLIAQRRERLTVLAQGIKEWCDAMIETTRRIFKATGARAFEPNYIIEYVRNSYEASFPVYVLKSNAQDAQGFERMTKVQMTIDRDITLSFASGGSQVRMPPGANERIFPKDLVVFEQKFDPEFIDISYDQLRSPAPNVPRDNSNQVMLDRSWGLQKMYALRKQIYSAPTGRDKRSGKAADVPRWIPEKFFLTWSDVPGRISYILDDKAREDGNKRALMLIGWDTKVRDVGWHLRQLIGRPSEDDMVSFEKFEQAVELDNLGVVPEDAGAQDPSSSK